MLRDSISKLRDVFGIDEPTARAIDTFIGICVKAEREECAKLVEAITRRFGDDPKQLSELSGASYVAATGETLARSIRERGAAC